MYLPYFGSGDSYLQYTHRGQWMNYMVVGLGLIIQPLTVDELYGCTVKLDNSTTVGLATARHLRYMHSLLLVFFLGFFVLCHS